MTPERNLVSETKEKLLPGKVALVTGSSRGIGAEIVQALASEGATVVITYREKKKRAIDVAGQIREISGRENASHLVQADITKSPGRQAMVYKVKDLGGLDILVLSAAGGLEAGIDEKERGEWAKKINITSQLELVEDLLPLIRPGGTIVYITSHWAHRYKDEEYETPDWYEVVASTKYECEQRLESMMGRFEEKGVELLTLSGPLTKDTSAYTLLWRQARKDLGLLARLRKETMEIGRWGEVLLETLERGFKSGDVVLVDKEPF